MERTIRRRTGKHWCEVTMKVDEGEFTMSGLYGQVLTREQAKEEAFEYWRSFFEDQPEELGKLVARFPEAACGYGNDAASSAANFVLETDGEFHGVEVHIDEENRVLAVRGGGQCREEINKWFPEVKKLWKWHLNNLWANRPLPHDIQHVIQTII